MRFSWCTILQRILLKQLPCPSLHCSRSQTPQTLSYTAARRRRGRWERRWRRRERRGRKGSRGSGGGGRGERSWRGKSGKRRKQEEAEERNRGGAGEMHSGDAAEALSAPPSSSSVWKWDKQEQDNINICSPQWRLHRLQRSGGRRRCD